MLKTTIAKPYNVFIIQLEGLDATGKETFGKSLKDYIGEFDWGDHEPLIVTQSFPNYESPTGRVISDILHTAHSDRDNALLDDLMFYDRINTMTQIMIDTRKLTRPVVLILDRYYFSNFVYSEQDTYTIQERFKEEVRTLPKPNVVVHFIPMTEDGKAIHMKQIEEKQDKDLNEVYSFQEHLMDKYIPRLKYSKSVYEEIDVSHNGVADGDVTIQLTNDVGSNYGNYNTESEIVSLLKAWMEIRGYK